MFSSLFLSNPISTYRVNGKCPLLPLFRDGDGHDAGPTATLLAHVLGTAQVEHITDVVVKASVGVLF